MINVWPASPGTVVRIFDADGDWTDTPVVGWISIAPGNMAQPIMPVGNRPILPNTVIITPGNEWQPEHFTHPSSGNVFNDWDACRDWIAGHLEENPVPAPTERADATKTVNVAPNPRAPLHFGAQTYRTKSYWHWPDQNAVFEIEGESVIPSDSRVKKVKRDEWNVLKRDGATVIDPHAGEVLEEAKTESTPQAPAEDESDEDLI